MLSGKGAALLEMCGAAPTTGNKNKMNLFYAKLVAKSNRGVSKTTPPFPDASIANLGEIMLEVLRHDFDFPEGDPLVVDGKLHRIGAHQYAIKIFNEGPVAVFTTPEFAVPVCTLFNQGHLRDIRHTDVPDWAGEHLKHMRSADPGTMLVGSIEVEYSPCH